MRVRMNVSMYILRARTYVHMEALYKVKLYIITYDCQSLSLLYMLRGNSNCPLQAHLLTHTLQHLHALHWQTEHARWIHGALSVLRVSRGVARHDMMCTQSGALGGSGGMLPLEIFVF